VYARVAVTITSNGVKKENEQTGKKRKRAHADSDASLLGGFPGKNTIPTRRNQERTRELGREGSRESSSLRKMVYSRTWPEAQEGRIRDAENPLFVAPERESDGVSGRKSR